MTSALLLRAACERGGRERVRVLGYVQTRRLMKAGERVRERHLRVSTLHRGVAHFLTAVKREAKENGRPIDKHLGSVAQWAIFIVNNHRTTNRHVSTTIAHCM